LADDFQVPKNESLNGFRKGLITFQCLYTPVANDCKVVAIRLFLVVMQGIWLIDYDLATIL